MGGAIGGAAKATPEALSSCGRWSWIIYSEFYLDAGTSSCWCLVAARSFVEISVFDVLAVRGSCETGYSRVYRWHADMSGGCKMPTMFVIKGLF